MSEVVLRGGPPVHPYIYSKRVLRMDRSVNDGDVVEVKTREGRPVGYGFAHTQSMISVRMLTYSADLVPDEQWLREKVRAADALRRDVLRLPEVTNAWRVAHAEADGLPGLVIDRYRSVLVAGIYSIGWYKRRAELERILREEAGGKDIVFRVDAKSAEQEGIPLPPRPRMRPVEIHENGVRYMVDPAGGHKTGFFLDQRENRQRLLHYARGRSVFDGMTYTGGFALAAAKGGATTVTAVDLDEDALEQGRRNADLNGLSVAFKHADVFEELRTLAKAQPAARPQLLIVDPAKWARGRTGLSAAIAKYRDLNRLALEAVQPGGLVVTNSCSGLVSEEAFLGVLRDVALDTKRHVRFLHVGGAPADHPVAANVPEGRYLKSVWMAVGDVESGPGRTQEDRRRMPDGARVGRGRHSEGRGDRR